AAQGAPGESALLHRRRRQGDVSDRLPHLEQPPAGAALRLSRLPRVSRPDDAYVGRLRARVAAARDRGIFVAVMLFQGWSVESKGLDRDPWRHHPMHRENNVNGIDGDADGDGQGVEVHTLALRAVTAVQEAYVFKVVEALNDLPNVLYEIGNELHAGPAGTAWQEHIVAVIRRLEAARPWQHPVLMSYPWPPAEDNTKLFRGPGEAG